jgi:hypothetical protein
MTTTRDECEAVLRDYRSRPDDYARASLATLLRIEEALSHQAAPPAPEPAPEPPAPRKRKGA